MIAIAVVVFLLLLGIYLLGLSIDKWLQKPWM